MSIVEWAGGHLAWKFLEVATEKVAGHWKGAGSSANWIARINASFPNNVRVICQNEHEPIIDLNGKFQMTESQDQHALQIRRELRELNRPNDPHAVMIGTPEWLADPPRIQAQLLDFAEVSALRKEHQAPPILSSCAVIVCPEKRTLIMHERASDVATYPNRIHTVGGRLYPSWYG